MLIITIEFTRERAVVLYETEGIVSRRFIYYRFLFWFNLMIAIRKTYNDVIKRRIEAKFNIEL